MWFKYPEWFLFPALNLTDTRGKLGIAAGRGKSGMETFCSIPFNTFSFFNHINVLLIPKINKWLKIKKNKYAIVLLNTLVLIRMLF